MMRPINYWTAREDLPACVTFIRTGGENLAVIAPLRMLTADEQNAAGRAFVKFCNLVRAP
jgi:hypothetical protein